MNEGRVLKYLVTATRKIAKGDQEILLILLEALKFYFLYCNLCAHFTFYSQSPRIYDEEKFDEKTIQIVKKQKHCVANKGF